MTLEELRDGFSEVEPTLWAWFAGQAIAGSWQSGEVEAGAAAYEADKMIEEFKKRYVEEKTR